ncbi:MAG TPA: hypothetical protein VGF56_16875 [Rhizomicrobium sp.]|jgi:hypothetical protein
MTTRLDIAQAVTRSYRFTFARYGALLGIVWLPGLLLIAVFAWAVMPGITSMGEVIQYRSPNPSIVDPVMAPDFARFALGDLSILCAYVWIGMGVVGEALGLRKGSRLVYLPGLDELRLAGAFFILFLIAYLVTSGLVLILVLAGARAMAAFGGTLPAFALSAWRGPALFPFVLLIVCVEIAAVAILVRLTFLMLPVALAEHRVTVVRSWRLMRGNVLRAIAVALLSFLPVFVLEAAFALAVLAHVAPWVCGLGLLAALPVVAGLIAAPSAFVYRELIAGKSEDARSN